MTINSDIMNVCRVCHDLQDDDDEQNQFMSPCKCSGSIKYIHFNCLVRYIEASQTTICDICLTNFTQIRIQYHCRSFFDYLRLNQEQQYELMFAIIIIVMMQISLICQLMNGPIERNLWIHGTFLIIFMGLYIFYLYWSYRNWVPHNRQIIVIKSLT